MAVGVVVVHRDGDRPALEGGAVRAVLPVNGLVVEALQPPGSITLGTSGGAGSGTAVRGAAIGGAAVGGAGGAAVGGVAGLVGDRGCGGGCGGVGGAVWLAGC